MEEHYLYHIPVFTIDPLKSEVNVGEVCQELKFGLPAHLLKDIDVIYFGEFPELGDRNAAFSDGAIYVSNKEPTVFDVLENVYHEVAHSLENAYGTFIFDENLKREFLGKRKKLHSLLAANGHKTPLEPWLQTEYSKKLDSFLSDVVGYPILLSLTMGLFVSPYGATSFQEYFANGFEKYFLGEAMDIKKISPVLFSKIESILNDNTD
jgi:hypothetical protein